MVFTHRTLIAKSFLTAKRWKQPRRPSMAAYRMDKQTVVYSGSGMLLGLQKEGHSDTCYSADGPRGNYVE